MSIRDLLDARPCLMCCHDIGFLSSVFFKTCHGHLRKIADEVAQGVFKELDYHNEAYNAELFLKKHRFLPFITAPAWLPEFTGPKGTARVLYLACERSCSKALLDFGFFEDE